MIKDLRITLYDIFGYLLPGSVILLAVMFGFWTLFWPNSELRVPMRLPYLALAALLFAAYLAGHLGQALGNMLESWSRPRKELEKKVPLSTELEKLLRQAVGKHFGKPAELLEPNELYELCDQCLVHYGSVGEREIFVYREGFYRGSSVALAFLTVAIILRLVWTPATFVITGITFELYGEHLAVAAFLTGLGTWLAYRRYLRFSRYRYKTCLLRFLSLWTLDPAAEKEKYGHT